MIYKKLQLSNYKAFDNITFDITSKKDTPKNLAIVFGPNGSGKSSLLESFTTLYNLMHTLNINKTLGQLHDKILNHNDSLDVDDINQINRILSQNLKSTEYIYNMVVGTNPHSPTSIKVEFQHNGLNGSYELQLYNGLVVYEELNYVLSKNQSCFFKIDTNKCYINQNLFNNKKEYTKLLDIYTQSWGRNSLISLINNELINYNSSYINNAYSSQLTDLLNGFNNFSYRICNYSNTIDHLSVDHNYLLRNITKGSIKKTSIEELKDMEETLLPFLQIIIDDLKSIKYIYDESTYNLELEKVINNCIVSIPYKKESSGIKEIINIIPYIIQAINGDVVIMDEYANHTHDAISYHLLRGILPLIKGQLILSTHSSILLSNCDNTLIHSNYFIEVKNSKRYIQCIDEIETKIRTNYNYQKRYIFDEMYYDYRNKISSMTDLYSAAINKYQSNNK